MNSLCRSSNVIFIFAIFCLLVIGGVEGLRVTIPSTGQGKAQGQGRGQRQGQGQGQTQGQEQAHSSFNTPLNPIEHQKRVSVSQYGPILALGLMALAIPPGVAHAASASKFYEITVPDGFLTLPTKRKASEVSVGLPEETLFQAQNYALGATLSITQSNVERLLKDFSVPRKGDIMSMEDVGKAAVVAQLLLLQRQGAFGSEWFKTTLKVGDSGDAAISNLDNNISTMSYTKLVGESVEFGFTTPLAAGIRRTAAKAVYRGGNLYVAWLSALDKAGGISGEEPFQLFAKPVLNSFELA